MGQYDSLHSTLNMMKAIAKVFQSGHLKNQADTGKNRKLKWYALSGGTEVPIQLLKVDLVSFI